ncbi:NLP/P60 hydrolase [Ruegeria marisrubri]|uniref:NLP/P60 hydrolase n=1 Tax=Ruegeria marisrubri TaxID=1685379 RepID=A0A0X3TG45_9RHOB|nr:NlpC/P60 family protein [Ruegeria marisrubri]KUJ73266.1 NLP/P60 hydrolase [Ruegeria marisrubri]
MTRRQITVPVVDLLRAPGGPRDRQLLFGDTVRVIEEREGMSRLVADKDGYSGWVPADVLGPVTEATHWVSAAATHVYARPDMKSPDRMSLSFGSRIAVQSESDTFVETGQGFIPKVHVQPEGIVMTDPVSVAELFLGTPYLWGGNSRFGLDCSGLVQAALLACGCPCPGDSGDQEAALGTALPPGSAPRRGDLLFWKGHVAWVADPQTLLHANAWHMAVQFEPLEAAIERIAAQGDGPVTAHKRL